MTAAAPPALDAVRELARELLAHDTWSRERLVAFQQERVRALVADAVARSPYYRETLGADAVDAPLGELPPLTKTTLMERFDDVVTDPTLRRADLERFAADAVPGAAFAGRYRVFTTSGATGTPALFVFAPEEFDYWVGAGLACLARVGVTPGTQLVAIGAPGDVHISRQLFAAFQAGREGVPRLSVATALDETMDALERYRPEVVVGYSSVLATLAEAQLDGRFAIEPRLTIATSEVLTEESARLVEQAWGRPPAQAYAATEAPAIATSVAPGSDLYVLEDSLVLEVVDAEGRAVPPGVLGSKVLLTNLVNRAQPLIRYELSDAVLLADGPDETGRPQLRIARVDGRSGEALTFAAAGGGTVRLHAYRLRAPIAGLLDVLQYQLVHEPDGGLRVDVVPRSSAARDLPERIRAVLLRALADAGVAAPRVRARLVPALEREAGPAAKLKLVRSEAPLP